MLSARPPRLALSPYLLHPQGSSLERDLSDGQRRRKGTTAHSTLSSSFRLRPGHDHCVCACVSVCVLVFGQSQCAYSAGRGYFIPTLVRTVRSIIKRTPSRLGSPLLSTAVRHTQLSVPQTTGLLNVRCASSLPKSVTICFLGTVTHSRVSAIGHLHPPVSRVATVLPLVPVSVCPKSYQLDKATCSIIADS